MAYEEKCIVVFDAHSGDFVWRAGGETAEEARAHTDSEADKLAQSARGAPSLDLHDLRAKLRELGIKHVDAEGANA